MFGADQARGFTATVLLHFSVPQSKNQEGDLVAIEAVQFAQDDNDSTYSYCALYVESMTLNFKHMLTYLIFAKPSELCAIGIFITLMGTLTNEQLTTLPMTIQLTHLELDQNLVTLSTEFVPLIIITLLPLYEK